MPKKSQFHSVEAQAARLMWVARVRTQTELARFLDISQASVSEGLKRDELPPRWILAAVEKMNVRPNWIRTGEGPMTFSENGGVIPSSTQTDLRKNHHSLREFPTCVLLEEIQRRKGNTT